MKHFYILLTAILFTINIQAQQSPFITTWQANYSENLMITIPTSGSGYNYTVDFGDGTVLNNITGNVSHTYSQPGVKTVSISGDFPRIYFIGVMPVERNKILSVEQWGDIAWTSMLGAFYGCSNLVINATDAPDLSQVTTMRAMFLNCTSFNQPINHWDVSNVTDVMNLFYGANSFNQSLVNWDVSSVTNMENMFIGANSFNQPLNTWNVSNVTKMDGMLAGAHSFNQPLSSWNVSNVTNMSGLFHHASSFNQNISDWNFHNNVSLGTPQTQGFLSNSGMNTENYDALLYKFAQLGLTNKGLGAIGMQYCAYGVRSHLINNLGWLIMYDSLSSQCNLGIADNLNPLNNITVYPNPTNKTLNIILTDYIQLEEVRIYDLQGKEVQKFQGQETTVDVENLRTGMYLLKITTNQGTINRQLIKN